MPVVVGKDPSMIKRCTCKNCASVIEYKGYEVKQLKSTDYSGCTDIYKYIVCPTCFERVYV